MRLRILSIVALCTMATAVFALRVEAGPTPAQKCLAKKLKEVGKYDLCRLKAESKAVKKAEAVDYGKCPGKLTTKWAKIEGAGGCTFTGDDAASQALSESHTDEVVVLLTGGSPEQKCLPKKLKEVGKYDSCRLKAESKAVLRGEAVDFTKCNDKFTTKWGKIDGSGDCSFTDDDTAAQALSDPHTDAVVDLLTNGASPATCGNATLDLGEQCDDTDLGGLQCYSLGYSVGVGALACSGACGLDTAGCVDLCGDGTVDAGSLEVCDGANLDGMDCTDFGGTGTLACSADCYSFDTSGCSATCGDNVAELDEACDGTDLQGESCASQNLGGGLLACNGSCEFDTSGCTATCGNGITNAGEDCDGSVFFTECEYRLFHSGTLSCDVSCNFDVSGCASECDYLTQDCGAGQGCYFDHAALGFGSNPGGCQTAGTGAPLSLCTEQDDCSPRHYCSGFGSEGQCIPLCDLTIGDSDCPAGYGFQCLGEIGQFVAAPNLGICTPPSVPAAASCGNGDASDGPEECDGADLGGADCVSEGFVSGTLACGGSCSFDYSSCVDGCGNGAVEGFESCDGADLASMACTDFPGFTGGTLACNQYCGFDLSGCTGVCGDAVVASPVEACEPAIPVTTTCENLGYGTGTVTCNAGTCQYDASGCAAPICGDGILTYSHGEDCDTANLGFNTCGSLRYHGGALSCDGSCGFDTSLCTAECDYLAQDCAGGEGCYTDFALTGSGGCEPEGSSVYQDACSVDTECAAGLTCAIGICVPYCDTSNGNADCAPGVNCFAVNAPNPNLGICYEF